MSNISAPSTTLRPHGLSQPIIIVIATLVSTAVGLTVVLGLIHCVRRRRHKTAHTRHIRDVERTLTRARRPILTVDTDVPRAQDLIRYASMRTTPIFPVVTNMPPAPMMAQTHTPACQVLPERVFGEGSQLARNATRNPLALHPPGVGGRSTPRPPRFKEVGLRTTTTTTTSPPMPVPMQVYDSEGMRTIYLG